MQELPISSHDWASGEPKPDLVDFLDRELRPKASYSVRAEYPSLFGGLPGGQSLVVETDGKIRAHVAFLAREYRHPSFHLKVGMIGSVVTAPDYRGKGFATTLLQQAFSDLRRKGCGVAVLWSEQPDFYSALGFVPAGRETDLRFSSILPLSPPPALPFEPRHLTGVWECYQRHPGGLGRTREEMEKLCSIPKSRIFVTEQDGKVTSYLAIQKGADFENYIHEWGGDLNELRRNIAWAQTRVFSHAELTLIAPAYYDLEPLRSLARLEWNGILGLMKVLDMSALWGAYSAYLASQNISAEWDKQSRVFSVAGRSYSATDEASVLRLIFGESTPPRHPVLPFFLWGFDSI